MDDGKHELCWKCEVEIDRERVIDFTLKNGKRVCEQCLVRETPWPELIRTSVESGSQKWRTGEPSRILRRVAFSCQAVGVLRSTSRFTSFGIGRFASKRPCLLIGEWPGENNVTVTPIRDDRNPLPGVLCDGDTRVK
jgi:hypothetical protein